ncbi:paraquat-inducible protein B [Proteus mirabilis]|nr:paraquat-inducible protein B [Proteus mirabilis]
MQQEENNTQATQAEIRRKRKISTFWLLPVIAIFIASWLLFQHWQEKGVQITIDFQSASGIVSGRTPIRYQGVDVGIVQDVTLSNDLRRVIVTADIRKNLANALRKNTQFWLVTPKASLSGVSGLDALVGGNYISMLPGDGEKQFQFVAQEVRPKANIDKNQQIITLTADNLGSLNVDSQVYYRKVPVGKVYSYAIRPDNQGIFIELSIDKQYAHLIRQDSHFWNVSGFQGNFNLKSGASIKMESVSALINGAIAFDSPENSPPAQENQQFVLQSATSVDAGKALYGEDGLIISLTSEESWGVDAGQPILFRGITIGQIIQRNISDDGVIFDAIIAPEYKHYIYENSKFVANSRINVNMGLNGIEIQGATPQEWLEGGIHLIPGSQGAPKEQYRLYRNDFYAKASIEGNELPVTLTLKAASLPGIQKGSVVLYHQFQVGEIVDVRPLMDEFDIDVHISKQYRHLLTEKSVFWTEGAAKVSLNGAGLTVEATPLNRALKGAISFDNFENINNNVSRYKLYPSETSARAIGAQITLKTYDASKLSEGMPIRYLGIDIGQVETLTLSADKKAVSVSAVLYPEYVKTFARSGSRFAVVTPELTASGLDNLDSLIQPYIKAEPGNGGVYRIFELQTANITDSRYLDGLNLVLNATEAGSVQIGTPIYYRGLEVGAVTGLELGNMSDRVLIHIRISQKYQYLVRNNTEFGFHQVITSHLV